MVAECDEHTVVGCQDDAGPEVGKPGVDEAERLGRYGAALSVICMPLLGLEMVLLVCKMLSSAMEGCWTVGWQLG